MLLLLLNNPTNCAALKASTANLTIRISFKIIGLTVSLIIVKFSSMASVIKGGAGGCMFPPLFQCSYLCNKNISAFDCCANKKMH